MTQTAIFDAKRDKELIAAGTHFWCEACLVARPIKDQSPDPRYCQGCHDFLVNEAKILGIKKKYWIPKPPKIKTTQVTPSVKTTMPPRRTVAPHLRGTQLPTEERPTSAMSPLKASRGALRGETTPRHSRLAIPEELIKQLAKEGMGSKSIATRLEAEGISVSYKTIQRILSGKRQLPLLKEIR